MKKGLLLIAAMLILVGATLPSFADGNPNPHASTCKTCGPLPTTR